LPATHRQLKKTLVAIGSLVGTLGRERQIVKDAFAETFTDFASQGNNELFKELFASQIQPGQAGTKKDQLSRKRGSTKAQK